MSLKREVGRPLPFDVRLLRVSVLMQASISLVRLEASNFRQNDHYAGLLQVMDDYAV